MNSKYAIGQNFKNIRYFCFSLFRRSSCWRHFTNGVLIWTWGPSRFFFSASLAVFFPLKVPWKSTETVGLCSRRNFEEVTDWSKRWNYIAINHSRISSSKPRKKAFIAFGKMSTKSLVEKGCFPEKGIIYSLSTAVVEFSPWTFFYFRFCSLQPCDVEV